VDFTGRRVLQGGVVVEMCLRGVGLHGLPSLSVVELHPVVLAIFNLAGALKSRCEEVAEVIVVGGVFEAEIADV